MMVESLFGIVWDVGIHLESDMGLSSGICWAHCCLIFIRYTYCLLYRIICCIVIATKRLFTLVVIFSFLVALQLFTSLTVPHSRQESFLK